MKFKLLLLFLLCISIVFCGCARSSTPVQEEDDEDMHLEEAEDTQADDEKKKAYTVIKENVFTEGDIQPVNDYGDDYMMAMEVSEYTVNGSRYLIDYSGNKLCDISGYDFKLCGICGTYTDHKKSVDPITYEIIDRASGHGGGGGVYTYDLANGEIFNTWNEKVTTNISYSIVEFGNKRPATKEDNLIGDPEFTFDRTGEYGIIVNSKLVVSNGYTAYRFFDNNGICALMKNGKWGYFNSEGVQILECDYLPSSYITDHINPYKSPLPYTSSCGYIALNKDGKWGYSDLEGNLITDFEFEEARPVYMGKAWVKINGAWSVIQFFEYDEGITSEEALAFLKAEYPNSEFTYCYYKNDTYFKTKSYCFESKIYSQINYYYVLNDGKSVCYIAS